LKYIYVLILLSIQLFGFSQNNILKVLDADTKQALPYVNICFESLETGKKDYTISNSNGEFENKSADRCLVSFSFVGYTSFLDTLTPKSTEPIYLQQDIFNLDQVVVTATRTEKALKDAPVITQVITSKEIENRGITNVKQVLEEDIPGLEFQRGGFGADIKMQGLESKNILILVDGERLAGETGSNIDYSRLDASNVERVEIVKGAASALYGSQAMGGVINIITKIPNKKLEISVGSQYTQSNEINYSNLLYEDEKYNFKKNLDLPNLNFDASVGFNLNGFWGRTDFSSKSFDAYQLYNTDVVVKDFIEIDSIGHDSLSVFPKGIQGYRDYTIKQKLNIPLHKNLNLELNGSYYNHNEYDYVPDNTYLNFIDYTFGGRLTYNISKDISILGSYHQDIYDKFDYYEKLFTKGKQYRNTFVHPRLISTFKIGEKQKFTTGVEYLGEYMLNELFTDKPDYSYSTSSFFIQDDIQFNKKWNVIAGSRVDNNSAFGLHFSPKLSTMYKYNKWSFRANYAEGFRSPSLKELYMDFPVAWLRIIGNEDLKAETNDYISFSSEYTKDWLNTSITIYKNWIKNKIDGDWIVADNPTYQYKNSKYVELSGVELLAKFKIMKFILLSGAYSYLVDSRPQADLVSSTSPHTGNIKLSYRYIHKKYEANISLSSIIIGAKDFINEEDVEYRGQTVTVTFPVHYDAYAIWKLTLNQTLLDGLNLTLGIENILDYRPTIIDFNTSMSPGRRGFVSLKINVDKLFNPKWDN
jgi:outer membrane receptor for ferrienterochelin and colicins